MGFAFCVGRCVVCCNSITFNPNKVPAIRIDGEKQPVCADCVARMQQKQRKLKVAVWPDPLPGAYEPCHESELA